ncbi:MAG TPA: NlpC/P60 family protein [Humibacter sp.]|nr:NlpC/P60 family protein [Humibacter sp.]
MRPIAMGAAAVGVITASIGIIAPPAYADDYPSWNDVQHAKQSVEAQQALVDKITGLVADLQSNVDAANKTADVAAEAYLNTKIKLDAATKTASELTSKSKAAAKTAKTSAMRAGLLASHLARAGGDSSVNLLLSGGKVDESNQLLYQLGTMSQLTEQSTTVYRQAVTDKNTADSLAAQAASAEKTRKSLTADASSALDKAKAAATDAQSALSQQQSKQSELVSQLASLKNTSEQQATQYLVGKKKADELAAAKAAAAEAATKASPPPPASNGGSTGGSGGSSGGGGSAPSGGGGSAPSDGGGSAGAPNSSAVETAIAYAYARQGAPYRLGGQGPVYYDCSGLVMMAYLAAGINTGDHSVTSQYYTAQGRGQLVPLSQRQRGDIIFWYDPIEGFYHDAIYLGGDQIIAARTEGEPLAVQSLWGTPYPYVARPSS